LIGYGLGLALSLAALALAGDQFIVAVARIASALRVRPTVVGAVFGGLGTSFPELVVSGVASLRGSSQIAVGNLVGSIIANLSLALAVAALVSPLHVDSRTVRREAPLSVGAVLLFAVLLPGGLPLAKGLVLIVVLIVSVAALLGSARAATSRDELALEVTEFFEIPSGNPAFPEIGRAVAGLALMLGGAELLVRSASGLASRLGLAQGFIGLTIVAVGTSAPLIAIAVQAARRDDHDLVVGAVLGGNLFIALGGGAIVALLGGASTSAVGAAPVVLMAALATVALGFMARGGRLNRWEAAFLVVAYGATLPFVAR
jgi:cation:H+ antiporter